MLAGYDQDLVIYCDWSLTHSFGFSHFFLVYSDIAPVLEGAVQHIASKPFELGGTDLTKLFAQELGKSNPLVNLSMSDVEALKEQYASCAEDEFAYEKTQNCEIEQHTLPDGQVCVTTNQESTTCVDLYRTE